LEIQQSNLRHQSTFLANIDEDTIIEIGTSIELDLESGDVGV